MHIKAVIIDNGYSNVAKANDCKQVSNVALNNILSYHTVGVRMSQKKKTKSK